MFRPKRSGRSKRNCVWVAPSGKGIGPHHTTRACLTLDCHWQRPAYVAQTLHCTLLLRPQGCTDVVGVCDAAVLLLRRCLQLFRVRFFVR
jgi:hypothetical protein